MKRLKIDKQAFKGLTEVFQEQIVHHGEAAEEILAQHLAEQVERDMVEEGFDPLNMNDVEAFWRQRGVEN